MLSVSRDLDQERQFQLLMWGYSIEGDVLEHDALLAEGQSYHRTRWDRTRMGLIGHMIDRGNGFEPVPDWWALQYLPMEWREVQHSNDG